MPEVCGSSEVRMGGTGQNSSTGIPKKGHVSQPPRVGQPSCEDEMGAAVGVEGREQHKHRTESYKIQENTEGEHWYCFRWLIFLSKFDIDNTSSKMIHQTNTLKKL